MIDLALYCSMLHGKCGKPAVPKILLLTGIGKHVCLNDIAVGLTA